MPTTVLEHIKGKDLYEPWRKNLKTDMEETFKITIEPEKKKAPQKGKWTKVTERISPETPLEGQSREFGVFSLGKTEEITREKIYDYL